MRIVHVIRNLHDGGMERIVADLVATMADLTDHELHVLSLAPGGRFEGLLEGRARIHAARGGGKLSLLRPAALAADIRALAPDVVHAHSGTWLKTARAAHLARVPGVAYTEHGRHHPDPWLNRRLDRWAARHTDVVAVVSSPLADHMATRVGVPREKIRVVVNGVDLEAVAAARPRTDLVPAGHRPFTFVAVGRLEPVKGLDQLVEVLEGWPADAPACRILLAGEGSERSRLERLVSEAGLEDRIRFLGWVDEPAGLFRVADGYLLPSHSEGTSISLLEALACACPAIASDVGGNRDILGDELAEWLYPPGQVEALRTRMVRLASSPALAQEVGARGRERIRARYSLAGMARRYLDLYAEITAPGRA